MPLLFALGQHTALSEASGRMREGERLMAFLRALSTKSGEAPTRVEALQVAAARVDPDESVWRSDLHSGPSETGITILGTPVGNFKDVRFYPMLNFGLFWAAS